MSRILVVEDDPAVLRGLKDNLTFESYDVLTATDAERAYQLTHDERPDLVLMDVMLPGMWGSELCRRVRAEGVTIPIVMLSAKAEESDRVLGLDLGADDYVSKPFGVRELSARIRSIATLFCAVYDDDTGMLAVPGLCQGIIEGVARYHTGARQQDDITVLGARVGAAS